MTPTQSNYKHLRYLLLIFFSIIVIGYLLPKKNLSSDKEEKNKTVAVENPKIEYDKKEFFDDLVYEGLERLNTIIDSSDEVRAYNWNGNSGNAANVFHHIVDGYGKFRTGLSQAIILSPTEVLELKEIIADHSIYAEENSDCFIPHIAFVYFKNQAVIGQSNICFLCAGIKSIPKSTKALNILGVRKLRKFCESLGLKIVDGSEPLEY
ncbi:hypothetical protein [Aureispira anguillae]|uniref:Uncharacterized protein n=1 Tax=Aureispira anguillae TaxID=2864201 RepID=A0A915YED2_9BACT|nr:hypothetical protein [Aureispira anguillae]BDS11563.1 hypothetical protein AsAng_0022770 [Aureispira anguillae]